VKVAGTTKVVVVKVKFNVDPDLCTMDVVAAAPQGAAAVASDTTLA